MNDKSCFFTDNWLNDIALIKLVDELPVDDDPNLAIIELPKANVAAWPLPQDQCIMNGWGCVAFGMNYFIDKYRITKEDARIQFVYVHENCLFFTTPYRGA